MAKGVVEGVRRLEDVRVILCSDTLGVEAWATAPDPGECANNIAHMYTHMHVHVAFVPRRL